MTYKRRLNGWEVFKILLAVIGAALVLAAVLAAIFPSARAFLKHPATIGWSSAIATLGAVLVALGSQVSQSQREKAEADEISTNVAALVMPELQSLLVSLLALSTLFRHLEATEGTFEQKMAAAERLEAETKGLRLPRVEQAFDKLHHLPDSRGRDIAYVLGLLSLTAETARAFAESDPQREYEFDHFRQKARTLVGKMAKRLCRALQLDPSSQELVNLRDCMKLADEEIVTRY